MPQGLYDGTHAVRSDSRYRPSLHLFLMWLLVQFRKPTNTNTGRARALFLPEPIDAQSSNVVDAECTVFLAQLVADLVRNTPLLIRGRERNPFARLEFALSESFLPVLVVLVHDELRTAAIGFRIFNSVHLATCSGDS